MIRRLKTRFTLLAMTAICVLLTVVVAGMNLINYTTVVSEADSTLELLSMNRGSFPDMKNDHMGPFPRPMSPELPYESRYFSVVLTQTGKVVLTDTGKIASVDSGTAAQYGVRAHESGKQTGFIGEFRYLRGSENNDEFYMDGAAVKTRGNKHGGILGGISTGMPIVFRAAIKPTPSIGREQRSVDIERGEDTLLTVRGRHDPCIVPRALPCMEAAMAAALYDAILESKAGGLNYGY